MSTVNLHMSTINHLHRKLFLCSPILLCSLQHLQLIPYVEQKKKVVIVSVVSHCIEASEPNRECVIPLGIGEGAKVLFSK